MSPMHWGLETITKRVENKNFYFFGLDGLFLSIFPYICQVTDTMN